jgi:hypothetical protein
MMRRVVFAMILLGATRAHAMGVYIDHVLVAWNDDGTAALISQTSSSSGTEGTARSYILVSADGAKPLVVSFDNTRDADTATQHVDEIACGKAVDTLHYALAAYHFRGVNLRKEQCKAARDVVALTPTTTADVASSVQQLGDGVIASRSGALILVIAGENGDGSRSAHVAVYRPGKAGLALLVDDVRSIAR